MCLIALAWRQHPRYPLAIAANRDEAHARPTAAAGLDPGDPAVYGGRDLVQGGGWLQVSTSGRLAAVTNVRNGLQTEAAPRSRGWLVRDFVRGTAGAPEFTAGLDERADEFGPFNLLAFDGTRLAFASNRPAAAHALVEPGLHAMSNGPFDAAWPKSGLATHALASWLESGLSKLDPLSAPESLEPLFTALADTTLAPDDALPDTGIGLELERRLSPPFVSSDDYGTRCSTLVLVGEDGFVFAERRFGPRAIVLGSSLAFVPRPRS
ncbi:NRDE family protein [Luteimonas sp. A501]